MSSAIIKELGLDVLVSAPRDAHLLILQRIFRLVAYGQSTLVLASYLHDLGVSDFRMGLFMTLTLIGDVGGSLVLTVFADRWGRRKVLTIGCGLMVMSGVVFCMTGRYYLLLAAAVVGVISPRQVSRQASYNGMKLIGKCSGNEIGPFKAIEESTLATLIPKDQRSTIFAWYALFSGLAGSLGSLSAGQISSYLQGSRGWSTVSSYRLIFALYSLWGVLKGGLTLLLSERCEAITKRPAPTAQTENAESVRMLDEVEAQEGVKEEPIVERRSRVLGLTPETQGKVRTLACLFGLDNLASGLVPL